MEPAKLWAFALKRKAASMYLEKIKSPALWETVRTDPRYRFLIDDLLEKYEMYCHGDIPDISYDTFMHYHRTGSRHEFEYHYYFPRRQRLKACAFLSLIYPDNEEYFSNLCNAIWAICNEYCWSLPNHDATSETVYCDDYIDLFAAETGYALSEIHYLLGDRFSSLLNQRITHAIDHRIIQSFIHRAYGWETVHNNWAAVCAGSVAMTFMHERPDLYTLVQPRIEAAMDAFLSSFKEDGVCQEGFGYWIYGFGFYASYAQMLLEFTKGEINLFDNPKVRKIAQFPNCVYLSGNATVSFSDGSRKSSCDLGITSLLRYHYGDILPVLPRDYYKIGDQCARWNIHAMAFAFYDPEMRFDGAQRDATLYFDQTGWFIRKNAAYGFAAKAGNNDEPHNHNDVGSFILAVGGEQVLTDLGSGIYTRDYFSADKRYTILCNRSLGHSVPLLDGLEQREGAQYQGTMDFDGETVTIDLLGAYPKNRVSSLKRAFTFTEHGFTMTDTYAYDQPCPVMERVVSLTEPVVSGNTLTLGRVTLSFSAGWVCTVSRDTHTKHLPDASAELDVYLIDFTPAAQGETLFTLTATAE